MSEVHGTRQVLKLSAKQRGALESIVARPLEAAGHVRRARVILLSADAVTGREIADRLGLSCEQVSRIRRRFLDERVGGLPTERGEIARATRCLHRSSRRSSNSRCRDVASDSRVKPMDHTTAREGGRPDPTSSGATNSSRTSRERCPSAGPHTWFCSVIACLWPHIGARRPSGAGRRRPVDRQKTGVVGFADAA